MRGLATERTDFGGVVTHNIESYSMSHTFKDRFRHMP